MLKAKFFQIAIIFCIVAGSVSAAFADTIRLKDGSVIKGHIIGFSNNQFTVIIGDGSRSRQMTFFSDEIDAIEFDGSNTTATKTNATTPATLPSRPNAPIAVPNNDSNDTKIIVGQKDTSSQPSTTPMTQTAVAQPSPKTVIPTPVTQPPVQTTVSTTQVTTPVATPSAAPNNSRPKPIQLNLKVLADNTSNGWTNAGWVVRKGQKIRITGAGRVSLGKGNYTTPAGIASLADKDKLMQNQPTGELIAVIGDDNNDFIPIGTSKEFIATRDGALFLGINEGFLDDNSGAFDIMIEIDPSSGN